MSVFADTSALYPLVTTNDISHEVALGSFSRLLQAGRPLWTTSFVLIETMALLQTRMGLDAAKSFDDDIIPVLIVYWVDEELYRHGTDRLWREDRRQLSLVDCVSFELMKREGISTAFAIDPHFVEAGFSVTPPLRTG